MKSHVENFSGVTQQWITYQVTGASLSLVENMCSTTTIFMELAVCRTSYSLNVSKTQKIIQLART